MLYPPRSICQFCRRPIYKDIGPMGNTYYRHVVASFDMVDFPFFHIAAIFVPEKVFK